MKNAVVGSAFFLVYGICVGTSTLIPYTFQYKPQDQGIAFILGGISTLLLFLFYRSLLSYGKQGEDLIDIIKNSFGYLASVFILMAYWLFIVLMTVKDMAIVWGTIGTLLLPEHTPAFIATILVVHMFLICVQGGINSIIQLSVFFSTICFLLNVLIFILSIANIQGDYFLPLFYNGLSPMLREFYSIASNSSAEIILLLFIPEVCNQITSEIKRFFIPILFIVTTNTLKYIVSVGLLGDYLQYVSITISGVAAGVLTLGNAQLRIEPLVILAWFVTAIVKLCAEYYILAKFSARLSNSTSTNGFLLPVGLLIWSLSLLGFQDQIEIIQFPKTYALYSTLFQILIPLIIWLGLNLKKARKYV